MIDQDTIREIQEMNNEGASVSAIAKKSGVSRLTVRKYLQDGLDDSPQLTLEVTKQPLDVGEGIHPFPRHSRLSKRIHPVSQVSPELKQAWEATEHLELQVKQARLRNEFGKVTANQQVERAGEKRDKWIQHWIGFALQSFDSDVNLETKVKLKKTIFALLKDVDCDEDFEAVRLLIEKKILPMVVEYNERYLPQARSALISFIVGEIQLPYLLPEERKEIMSTINEWLESSLIGDENESEMLSLAQTIVDEMVAEL